jgi:outer membrane protein assembly factor BamE (lipoprotein component of BamABCDE complex)
MGGRETGSRAGRGALGNNRESRLAAIPYAYVAPLCASKRGSNAMTSRTFSHLAAAFAAVASLAGCMSAAEHRADVQAPAGDRLTVGTVQKEIRVGMSGAEVAAVLGSPNIVSTDEERREVWIYDKISTDVAYSSSSGGVSALILGGSGGVGGGVGGSGSRSAGAASTSQQTLTVIIKFDNDKKVRDFGYHTSRF